ncbi:hypothetical protein ONS95_000135 [Cadophora gregata]|uniref:uncharacterized protein n=1 Tax=Cadophora gregata TaxID=51156 RepID=UPI0026DCDE64|nr:uncharacterized protein ONS95_000135 [Cadophora gregata]KAK0115592.1 hypothetical protein ONS96_014042 [Cadophora gregata f. sp. sojae]KAK0128152.1 hypothetical protein ONS95_000135 [Cadophora gregata]
MQAAVSLSARLSDSSLDQRYLVEDHPDNHKKRVRFDLTAVDNEYKMRSRQKRASSKAIAAFPPKTETFPLSWSSGGVTAPNDSRKIQEPTAWSFETDFCPQETRRHYQDTEIQYSAQPPWTFYPLTQTRARASLPRIAAGDSEMTSKSTNWISARRSANSAAKRDKAPRGKSTSHVPPKVPDAPSRQSQRPPSAPRPSRIPTPDLMDIGGEMFCDCDVNVYGRFHVSAGMNSLAKMDAQLQAAEAHMKHEA